MRNTARPQVAVLALFVLPLGMTRAQTSSVPPALRTESRAQVYLPGFVMQNATTEADRNLGNFVDRLLGYRLGELSKVHVNWGVADSGCTGPSQNPFQSRPSARNSDNRPLYVVRGSIEFHPGVEGSAQITSQSAPSADLILNYELGKVVNCVPQVLMRRSEPLGRPRLVESLTVMADAIALRLGDEVSRRTRIDIVPLSAGDSNGDEQGFANSLTDALVQGLARTDDFEPIDLRQEAKSALGDYSLETTLRFSRSANLFKGFGEEVQITLHLRPRSATEDPAGKQTAYSLTGVPIRGYLSQKDELISKTVTAALKGISGVREAREAGLPESSQKLNELQVNDLVLRAQEALCEGADNKCVSRPDVALVLLQQAAKKNAQDIQVQEWTARALYASGKFLEAAKSYDAILASNRSLPLDTTLRLDTAAGDAWYGAQSFSMATARFDHAAQILSANPELTNPADINLRRSLSHRFSGDRLGALDALIHPVGTRPDSAVLVRELTHLIENLGPAETDKAVARLEAEHDRPDLKAAFLAAYQKQAGFLIGQAQFGAAEKTVRKALALEVPGASDGLNYFLALVYFNSANQQGASEDQKVRQYRDSSRILQEIVERDPAAQSFAAIQLELAICSDYLGDKQCVQRTTALLSRVDPASVPVGLQLDLIELQILEGAFQMAKTPLDRVLSEKNLQPAERTVGYFYRVWIDMAENRNGDAEQSFLQWDGSLKTLRQSGGVINWVFGGARRSLENGGAGDRPGKKELLRKMIEAMEDPKHTVPRFEP